MVVEPPTSEAPGILLSRIPSLYWPTHGGPPEAAAWGCAFPTCFPKTYHGRFEYWSHGEKEGEGKGSLQKRKYKEDQRAENRGTCPSMSKTRRCSPNTWIIIAWGWRQEDRKPSLKVPVFSLKDDTWLSVRAWGQLTQATSSGGSTGRLNPEAAFQLPTW